MYTRDALSWRTGHSACLQGGEEWKSRVGWCLGEFVLSIANLDKTNTLSMWGVSNERHVVCLLFTQSENYGLWGVADLPKNSLKPLKTSKQKVAGGLNICNVIFNPQSFLAHTEFSSLTKSENTTNCTESDMFNSNVDNFHMCKEFLQCNLVYAFFMSI